MEEILILRAHPFSNLVHRCRHPPVRSLKQIKYGSRLYLEAVFLRIATDVVGFFVQHGITDPWLAAKPGQLYSICPGQLILR